MSTVTTPVHVLQPIVGPPLGSSAMFHVTTDFAQLRVLPMIRFSACHIRVSENVFEVGFDWMPEHSVKYASLDG